MPGYPWLARNTVDGPTIATHMRTLKTLGVPYSDTDIAGAEAAVTGKTEQDAVIAYLQGLGTAFAGRR
jgi:cytochrome c oxidase cbb3-type subunit 2